jgi:hypothetical protein
VAILSGEANVNDSVGENHAMPLGQLNYTNGKRGQAFLLAATAPICSFDPLKVC